MKKILITGASGFVGSHLVEEALEQGLDVYAGIRKSSSREYLQDKRIQFFELNFSNKEEMADKLRSARFDFIVHNAGIVAAPKPEDYFRVNFEFVRDFVEAIHDAEAVPEKFTFISSLASYGPASAYNLSDFLKEEYTPKPIDTYGRSKLKSEQYLHSVDHFPYVIIRPTAVYGPREKEILTFFKLLNLGLEGYIGNKEQRLTFIYVKDLARAIIDATLSEHRRKAYFIADGNHHLQWDLGKYGKRFMNKKSLRVHVPTGLVRRIAWLLEQGGKFAGTYPALNLEKVNILESQNWQCDISPAKSDFNFDPKYDLEKGLEETIAWYKENNWL